MDPLTKTKLQPQLAAAAQLAEQSLILHFTDPPTLGSGTLVCDSSTQIGHSRPKWAQNCSI